MSSKNPQNIKQMNKLIINAIAKKRFTSRMAKRLAKQLKSLGMCPREPLAFIADTRDRKYGRNKDGMIITY